MDTELFEALREYLLGNLALSDLGARIAAFDWDDGSAEAIALRPAVGMLELLIEEVGEGLRDEAELKLRAREILNAISSATSTPGRRRL